MEVVADAVPLVWPEVPPPPPVLDPDTHPTADEVKRAVKTWAAKQGFGINLRSSSASRLKWCCSHKGRKAAARATGGAAGVLPENSRRRGTQRAGPDEEPCPFE